MGGLGVIQERPSSYRRQPVGLQQEIVEDTGAEHQPPPLTVLRDITHAASYNRLRAGIGHICAADLHRACHRPSQPDDYLGELALSIAVNACDPQNLPTSNLKGDA